LVWLFILSFSLAAARAQDAATQQQMDQINGRLQDILDAQAAQGKRIDALEKEISELRDKPGGSGASQDELKNLADQVQEIDKKRQADRELILKEIEKLGKAGSSPTVRRSTPPVTTNPPRAVQAPVARKTATNTPSSATTRFPSSPRRIGTRASR